MKSLFTLAFLMITAIVINSVISETAWAYKGVRGGNGVGGTLRDRVSHGTSERLDGLQLLKLTESNFCERLEQFPFIREFAFKLLAADRAKAFYLESRELHPDCLNPSTVETGAVIWACQNDVEIRINANWWKSASQHAKADLLLHEILTALYFDEPTFGTVEPSFAAFVNPNLTETEIETEIWRLHGKSLFGSAKIKLLQMELQTFARAACKISNELERFDLLVQVSKRLERSIGAEAATLFVHASDSVATGNDRLVPKRCGMVSDRAAFLILYSAWLKN